MISHADAGRPFLWGTPCGVPRATNPDGGAGMLLRLATQPSLFGLAPDGVYPAAPVARGAVRSCRTVSPLPAGGLTASCTGGLFSVALSLGSPPPAVSRHRIPVEPGLSSVALRRQRPSGRLAGHQWWKIAAPVKQGSAPRLDGRRKLHPAKAQDPVARRRTPASRAIVPASAWPVIASGRQWRWKARSTVASGASWPPSGAT